MYFIEEILLLYRAHSEVWQKYRRHVLAHTLDLIYHNSMFFPKIVYVHV